MRMEDLWLEAFSLHIGRMQRDAPGTILADVQSMGWPGDDRFRMQSRLLHIDVQRNAEGTVCKTSAFWDGKIHKSRMEPIEGTLPGRRTESWRFMESGMMVRECAVVSKDDRACMQVLQMALWAALSLSSSLLRTTCRVHADTALPIATTSAQSMRPISCSFLFFGPRPHPVDPYLLAVNITDNDHHKGILH